MKKTYTLLLFISIINLHVFSQISGVVNYSVTIPGTTVTNANVTKRSAFVIDNVGNKWIGLNSGGTTSFQLLRFNGTQWDTFPAFVALSATNKVNALAVDVNNNLWIGSNMGLTVYNGSTFTTYNTANSGLISDTVTAIGCGNGNVYVGSNHGLSVYNGTSFTNYTIANGMNNNIINCITVENANAIWIGNNNGLDKFNGNSFTFNYVTANNSAEVVNCIYVDAQGNKWIGTNAHGAIKYDNNNFYSMQQLFPFSVTNEMTGIGIWPTVIKTFCKGPHGGVLFSTGPQSFGTRMFNGRSYEILNGQLNTYMSICSATTTGDQQILQNDVGSNKIFVLLYPTGPTTYILTSYDSLSYFYTNASYAAENVSDNAFLDINNVSCLINNNSQMHWDYTSFATKYFVPKQSGSSPLFNSAMWIGGYSNGLLHTAAMTYRQNGIDFWPGPLNPATDSIDNNTVLQYDKSWKINRFDVANFIYHWNAGDIQNGSWVPPADFISWPGNSPYTGHMLAPYYDYNNDGFYNWHDGDYPAIKGDQMVWTVYNDAYLAHTEEGGKKLGIEVQASSYAFICPSIADSNAVLNNTTFYHYEIYNRSVNQYDSTNISLWMDSDLGNYQDDYVGCDVMNDFGYTYNGDIYDEDNGNLGYHYNVPIFACNILSGPIAVANDGIDNNHNCQIDEPGERCMMNGFTYYNNTGSPLNGNPPSANGYNAYYNLMNSKWENGTSMTYGNQGLTTGGQPCKYLFPGNSDPYGYGLGGSCNNPIVPTGNYGATGWTENQASNVPGDRRFMVNVGKFIMQPGGKYDLDYALVFSQDSATCDTNNTCLMNLAIKDNQRVKRWFNNNSYPSCLNLSTVGIKQNATPQLNLNLYPNPANSNVYIEFNNAQQHVTIEVYDMLGNVVGGYAYDELNKYAVIPVSMLQSGVYMIKIQSAEGTANKKFIKE